MYAAANDGHIAEYLNHPAGVSSQNPGGFSELVLVLKSTGSSQNPGRFSEPPGVLKTVGCFEDTFLWVASFSGCTRNVPTQSPPPSKSKTRLKRIVLESGFRFTPDPVGRR